MSGWSTSTEALLSSSLVLVVLVRVALERSVRAVGADRLVDPPVELAVAGGPELVVAGDAVVEAVLVDRLGRGAECRGGHGEARNERCDDGDARTAIPCRSSGLSLPIYVV
jgi:hypothetical protein